MKRAGESGRTLLQLLIAAAIGGLAVAAAAPTFRELGSAGRAAAGARLMAGEIRALRWKAVNLGRSRGMFFKRDALGWHWIEVEDGNGNGLRTAEIRSGTDRTLGGPYRLEHRIERVTLGFPPGGPFPRTPPNRGTIPRLDDPVKFGRPDVVSFSPKGDSSSGTLYVTDGRHALYAVVVFGPSVKLRVWRYDTRTGTWKR